LCTLALWAIVSAWKGSANNTVNPSHAGGIVAQWRGIHGVADQPATRDVVGECARDCWTDPWHGARHATQDRRVGSLLYALDVGISSTHHIARTWGLLQAEQPTHQQEHRMEAAPKPARVKAGVGAIIEDALRSIGLMR